MRRLWLLFAQTVTVVLALYFVYATVGPHGAAPVRLQQMGS
ncbi:MAG TPA: 2-alkenal reductase, partial [Duganella sp.]|nr:2-alkenal reductase [Duganella sp.]